MIIHWVEEDGQIMSSYRFAMFSFEHRKHVVVRDYLTGKFLVLVEGEFEVESGKGIPQTLTRRKL